MMSETPDRTGETGGPWVTTADRLPLEGVTVECKNGDIVQTLVYERNLWWFPDRSMYVYFTPKAWRSIDDGGPGGGQLGR